MRILMLTQKVDFNDDVLGFTHEWIATLAARVTALDVIALEVGDYNLPPNVTVESMGKELHRSRPGLLATLYRKLARKLPHADAIFVHMVPRYVLTAAPLAALYRKPITLWFTHRSNSRELRLATRVVHAVATAHESSFPFYSPKVHALGHGINTTAFYPADDLPADPPMILSLARLSPIKRHETLIRAAALLRDKYGDPPLRIVIAGGAPTGQQNDYPEFLRSEIERLQLGDRVTLWGAVPAGAVQGVLHQASLAFNGSPPGLFDKAVLEAMLCAVPTVVSNAAFNDLLGDYSDRLCIADGDDARALAEKLNGLLRLPAEARRAIGLVLRDRTAAAHSLDNLMDKLVALMTS